MKTSVFFLSILIALFSFCSYDPNGDTCHTAVKMPNSATSTLTEQIQNAALKWYTFTPTTPEIKITLTNTSMGSSKVSGLILKEGVCSDFRIVALDTSLKKTTLTVKLHEALVGTPYYITTYKCSTCTGTANFNLEAQSLTPPVQTVSNGIVYLDGKPSHKNEQVIIRVDKNHLIAANVNNTSLTNGIASQFFDKTVINSIAHLLYNGNISSANNLLIKKVYPKMTFADTLSLSIDSQLVRVPPLFETFVITLPKNTTIFRASRILSTAKGVKYAEPNYAAILMSN